MSPNYFRLCPAALAVASVFPAFAAEPDAPGSVTVLQPVLVTATVDRSSDNTSDSSRLLERQPGYFTAAGGGVSGLPVANGLADDRLNIRIDGMELTAACGNHMNAPLSYVPPGLLGSIRLHAGVTAVSEGGDNIGGAISVKSPDPVYAAAGEGLHKEGTLSLAGRTVNSSYSAALAASVANDWLSLGVAASQDRGASYHDGNGDKVLDSLYKSGNSRVTLAARGEAQQLVLRFGEQRIPYQGFPNEYMDMTGNHARFANADYTRDLAWGKLEAKAFWQETRHEMGFFSSERSGTMPMNTQGRNMGYTLQAEIPQGSTGSLWRIGQEYHHESLRDWWPAVPGSSMMGPNEYINVNDGRRDRFAVFGERESRHTSQWSSVLGVRVEQVRMNTGDVQAYGTGMMQAVDNAAAKAFNARDKQRSDENLDLSAIARYVPDTGKDFEFGVARKTRSPNLYEAYAWGRSTMGMTMTNWFGDGNGYVGNPDLKPEVAYTASTTANWHDATQKVWTASLTPYYSYIENFIDVDVIGRFSPYGISSASGNLLQFANHDARLYGVNASGSISLGQSAYWGVFDLRGTAAYTRGRRTDGGNLYRIAPLTATLAVDERVGAWTHTIDTRFVAGKHTVDENRLEVRTGGYALLGVHTKYQWNKRLEIAAGVSNVLDKYYADPFGGVYLSGLSAGVTDGALQALPGYGRSLDVSVTLQF